MEQIRNSCTLEGKRSFVIVWDGLITLYNLYLLLDVIYIFSKDIIFLFPILSFIRYASLIMWVAHYSYNCVTKYSEKYEWAIYIKFVYLLGFLLHDIYLLLFGSRYYYLSFIGLIRDVLVILAYLISIGLEYIYLDHLKVTRKQGNNGNNYRNLSNQTETTNSAIPMVQPQQTYTVQQPQQNYAQFPQQIVTAQPQGQQIYYILIPQSQVQAQPQTQPIVINAQNQPQTQPVVINTQPKDSQYIPPTTTESENAQQQNTPVGNSNTSEQ